MAGETQITIIGNLTDDPELRFTPSGAAVAKMRVATTPRLHDKDSGEWKDGTPSFYSVSIWRQAAENVAESLTKGARVIVVGTIAMRQFEHNGEKRTVYEITADEIAPSLRYATANITKAAKGSGSGTAARTDDPWATASASRPASNGGGNFDDEPPF